MSRKTTEAVWHTISLSKDRLQWPYLKLSECEFLKNSKSFITTGSHYERTSTSPSSICWTKFLCLFINSFTSVSRFCFIAISYMPQLIWFCASWNWSGKRPKLNFFPCDILEPIKVLLNFLDSLKTLKDMKRSVFMLSDMESWSIGYSTWENCQGRLGFEMTSTQLLEKENSQKQDDSRDCAKLIWIRCILNFCACAWNKNSIRFVGLILGVYWKTRIQENCSTFFKSFLSFIKWSKCFLCFCSNKFKSMSAICKTFQFNKRDKSLRTLESAWQYNSRILNPLILQKGNRDFVQRTKVHG